VSPDKVPIRDTWECLEAAVDSGIVKSIGVSNFSTQLLYDLLSYAKYPVSSLQIEHHPYLVQKDLIAMAQENDIVVTGYSSFGPASFLELPEAFRKRADAIEPLMNLPSIKEIAQAHSVTPAQVLLRWATQRFVPRWPWFPTGWSIFRNIAVIPKSNSKDRLKQNLDVVGFSLTEDQLEEISGLDRGLRFNDPGFYLPNYPLRIFAW
jgi:D-xylose reductase